MNVTLLRDVIFTAGVVFDNLSTSWLATGRFLQSSEVASIGASCV